jgi:MFS family permease
VRTRFRPPAATAPAVRQIPFDALILADAVSLTGNAMAQLAVPWFVLETTGSVARTGIVAFFGLLPTVLAALLGGAVVDRLGHRRASLTADAASMVAVGMIPLLHAAGLLGFWLLLSLVFLGAVLDAPGAVARAALLPTLAERAGFRLERANAVHEVIESGAQLAGPVVAGLLIAWVGPGDVLWVNAATFAVSALLVGGLVPAVGPETRGCNEGRYVEDLMQGVRFVFRDPPIRSIFVSAVALNLLISPLFSVVLPVLMAAYGNGNAVGLGSVIGAFGGGSVVGASVFGAVAHRLPRRATFLTGVCAIGAAIGVVALLPPLPVMVGVMLVGGMISGPNGPLVATVLQERTPPALRGRVFGATAAVGFAGAPLGVLAAGYLLEAVGVQATLLGIAATFFRRHDGARARRWTARHGRDGRCWGSRSLMPLRAAWRPHEAGWPDLSRPLPTGPTRHRGSGILAPLPPMGRVRHAALAGTREVKR